MSTLLNEAKKRFKKGDLFLSATGNIKSPLVVSGLLVADNYPETIVNENGGVIATTMEYEDEEGNLSSKLFWATKVTKTN